MNGRVIPTASLVVLTAAISAGITNYRSGSHEGEGGTQKADWPTMTLPGTQERSTNRAFARADYLSSVPTPAGGPNRSLEDEIRELQDAVTALGRAVAALERERFDYARDDRYADDAPVDSAPGTGAEQPADFLSQRYDAESRDAVWAARAEPVIGDVFRHPELASSRLIYNSCKTTVCRIEVNHDDDSAADNFLFRLLPLVSDQFAAVETRLVDDAYGLRTVVLLGNAN